MKTLLTIIVSAITTLTISAAVSSATPRGNAIISFDCEIVMKSGNPIEVVDCKITGLVPRRK